MCGIVGILLLPNGANPRRLAAVEDMSEALHHRGPDGGSSWMDPDAGIAFGHRRLAIVDLSDAGRQPMVSASERLVMTYNGEIYNFAELRKELEDLGHHFRGHSDSEVMLAAFERYGIEASLTRLAGMFAVGLWDRKDRVLHLVRDRMGKSRSTSRSPAEPSFSPPSSRLSGPSPALNRVSMPSRWPWCCVAAGWRMSVASSKAYSSCRPAPCFRCAPKS